MNNNYIYITYSYITLFELKLCPTRLKSTKNNGNVKLCKLYYRETNIYNFLLKFLHLQI